MDDTSTGGGVENTDVSGAAVGARDLEEDYLAGLQKSLAGRVASLRIVTPERGSPYLEVVSKSPEKASADVWVALADGVWWFWWGCSRRGGSGGRTIWTGRLRRSSARWGASGDGRRAMYGVCGG